MGKFLLGLFLFAAPLQASEAPRILAFLDPGHGGPERGVKAAGLEEASLTLEFAKTLQAALKARGISSALSREDDSKLIKPSERSVMANASGARVYVGLHVNYSAAVSAQGFRVFVPKPGPAASSDSAILWETGASAYEAQSRRLGMSLAATLSSLISQKTPVQSLPLASFRGLAMPAIVVELGYASHAESLERLKDPEWKASVASRMAAAIREFLRGS